MNYNLGFGLDQNANNFGESGGSSYDDETANYMEKAQRALQAREFMSREMSQDPPPAPVNLPRIKDEMQKQSFFQGNPGMAQTIDTIALVLSAMNNRKVSKQNAKAGRYGRRVAVSDPSTLPLLTPQVRRANALQNEDSQNVQGKNAQISEAESRINSNAMSRYATRRSIDMGQMTPALARAAFPKPAAAKAPPPYQQKLETLKTHPAYLEASPRDRNAMELHVIGAEPKTSEDTATVYSKTYARLQAKDEFQKTYPSSAGGIDAKEKDIATTARYVADLIHNDFVGVDKATEMGLDFMRNLQKIRTATGKPSTMTPGTLNPPPPGRVGTGGLPPGVPASPAGGSYQTPISALPGSPGASPLPGQVGVKGDIGGLAPDLGAKISLYAQMVNRHPESRAQLREDIMRNYGVDPDLYLTTGP